MELKISVIIPVYNAEKYLKQLLDSITGQTISEIEVICVDDGSTDSSAQIIKDYMSKDERIHLLTQENLHAGPARNNGLALAKGEYVHFMDADDYLATPYAYEAIYDKVKKHDLDCLKFCGIALDETLKMTVPNSGYSLQKLRDGDFLRLLPLENDSPIFNLCAVPWSGLYRRSFLIENDLSFNDLICVNDRSFFISLITTPGRIMASRDPVVVHRVNMETSLVDKRAMHFECQLSSLQIIESMLLARGISADIFKKVMCVELDDLLYWCGRLSTDETCGDQIIKHTQDYIDSQPYHFMVKYQNRLKKIIKNKESVASASEEPSEQQTVTEQVFYEECADPKVSVVVPVYNQEDYLNQALWSLTRQTLKEMDFICVNDGSDDTSMTILKEYASIDKRIRIIDKKNTGYGHSMNIGIDAARGQYLGILEPDDFVPSTMYEQLYDVAAENELDLVKADFYRFGIMENGAVNKKRFDLSGDKSYYGRVIDPSEETEVFYFLMNTWSGIYNLEFLNRWEIRHHESPGASYQDLGFWFQTFCRAKRIWFLDSALYMYRRDNPNASMFSKGKFYAHTEEYRFIWDFLSKEYDLVEKYEKIFYFKKFNSFSMTYYRLDTSLKRDYLHHIYDEFREPMAQGKLDESCFEPRLWLMLNEIMEDPDAFYDKLRISVIIPAYNAASFIRECLDSILVRDEIRSEVICVDDGSTDETLEILREYEEKDSRVRVIHQENAGAGAARNTGMKYATGDYFMFLDADDFFDPDMFRRAYEKARTEDSDIVVFRSDQYFMESRTYQPARFTVKYELLPVETPFAGSDIKRDIFRAFVGWPWDKLFKAGFIRENNLTFQEQRTTNDMLFVFSAIVKAQKISIVEAILAHHRRADDGKSLSVSREMSWRCFYDALIALKNQLTEWDLFDRYERDFVDYALHFTLWNLNTIKGESYYRLYNILKEEWLDNLGITGRDVLYFNDEREYEQLQQILSGTADDYLFYRLDTASWADNSDRQDIASQKEIEKLKRERQKLWETKRERGLEIHQLRREKYDRGMEIHELRREKQERGIRIRELQKKIDKQKEDLNYIKKDPFVRLEQKAKKIAYKAVHKIIK